MRSRYSAYVLQQSDYLQATWHVSTRPAEAVVRSRGYLKSRLRGASPCSRPE